MWNNIKKNHTPFLFSILLRPKFELLYFLFFCLGFPTFIANEVFFFPVILMLTQFWDSYLRRQCVEKTQHRSRGHVQMDSEQFCKEASNEGAALSGDAKPRLKWTQQLHQLFRDSVSQLGGVDKATPKSVLRLMGIPGLTVFHIKSHLQKYRLAKNQEAKMLHQNREQAGSWSGLENMTSHDQENEAKITMLKVQMEVQRKLQEQIEVQRHLQIRIEAQGKYLESVLKKAEETLAAYGLNANGVECMSSSFSQDTITAQAQQSDCSTDSCLTLDSGEFNPRNLKRRQRDLSHELCRVKRRIVVSGEDRDDHHGVGGSSAMQEELDLNI